MKIAQAVPATLAALTMKTIITSNWRPLRSALCTLLLGIAALWAMPRSSHAQLYVGQGPVPGEGGTVGEYNVTTGAAIKFLFITGLSEPEGLALSGNNLFVAQEDNNTVGEYNATTGAAINPNFITGVSIPAGLALSGNNLFVASQSGTVGEYDVSTNPATLINANFITGLNSGGGAYALALSGNNLFVANIFGSTVGEYNVSTNPATLINANFITGLSNTIGLAVSGNNLFVAIEGTSATGGSVGEYNLSTGTFNPSFITGLGTPGGLAVLGNDLFVVIESSGSVREYNVSTNPATLINAKFITGLPGPIDLAVAATLPIANAGLNLMVQAGTLVTLDGSASSDPSGQLPLTYAWSFVSQPGRSTATLSNPAIVNPTFTPNALGSYVIQLVVTDAAGLSSAPASVTISTTDAPPVANAGPAQMITAVGTLVQLNGSQSYDAAGLPITYQWSFVSKPAGSSATLTGPTTATPSFLADVAGDYTIQLVVTDSLGTASTPATVNVSFNDVAPIANAGSSQSAVVGETVTLNGSKSTDTDGEPLTYNWSVVSAPRGSKAAISNPTAEIASLVPDLPGTFVVQLIVNDGFLNSLPATTEIVAVSQRTLLTQQIRNLQGVIRNLPPSAFRNVVLKEALLIELNAVLLSVEEHHYRVALLLLQDVILPQTNGCATTGAPDRNDWITNCPDQSIVYTPLLNIIAEVKAFGG